MEAMTKLGAVALVMAAAIVGLHEPKMANASDHEICGMTIDQIMSCKASVTGDSELGLPPPACCSALQHADVACLCQFKSYLLYFDIEPKVAMQLPEKCKLPNAKSFHC